MDRKCNDNTKSWKATEDIGSSASQADRDTRLPHCKTSGNAKLPRAALFRGGESPSSRMGL